MTIRVITDSASDIPWAYAKEKNVEVVSLTVSYYDNTYTEDEEFDLEFEFPQFFLLYLEKIALPASFSFNAAASEKRH